MFEIDENKNPWNKDDATTPLHLAVCKFIIGNVENKKSGNNDGTTPLHLALFANLFLKMLKIRNQKIMMVPHKAKWSVVVPG